MKDVADAKILVIDDDRSALESLSDVLRREEYQVYPTTSSREALRLIGEGGHGFDLVMTDLRMKEVNGLEVLHQVRAQMAGIPVIMLTAFADMESAVEAINQGAFDYLSKPFKLDHLRLVVRRALEQSFVHRENVKLKSELETQEAQSGIVGRSPEMVEVYKMIARVAPLPTTVLIQGESGTGKELVAKMIHILSKRTGAFRAINCGALTESLLESELFGYVKGAFTGASTPKKGVFEAANRGTCFLDEIGDTSPALQMKLLRVVEEREVLPVGATETVPVDVRIVSATNRPLPDLVEEKTFREDLFYRLKVVTIELPPLRERRGDLPLLLDHFVRHFAAVSSKSIAVSDSVYRLLASYSWPGNVRELEHAVERAIALNRSGVLTPDDFPEEIKKGSGEPVGGKEPASTVIYKSLAEKELEYVRQVLRAHDGNVTRAAEVLGIDRRTIYRILERHGVEKEK
jgi:DNA-binding NtrC family response regulator